MSFYTNSSKNRRDRILHTALKLFHSKGYFKTSVHDIREQADVSIGLVYRYFKNKEEIAQTLYQEISEDIFANIEKIIAQNANTHDRCRAIMAYYLQLTEDFPELVDFIIFARHKEIMPSVVSICAGKALARIRQTIQEGIENGEIRPLALVVAGPSLFGGMTRLIQLRLIGMVQEPLPSLLDEIWESAWRAVKA
ncbi:TetR/AcrR family transcriptional regulator [Thiovibrio sp. JS02]